jgi:flagellar basal-body rod modification protein FlgD|tara:strand:+ start:841 stop:1260 length:420 start_codon:yes stop_codon:yes gene_type:complete
METGITSVQQLAQNQGIKVEYNNEQNDLLDMDDFFKLLTVQLTSQDPLKPMEDTEFISQMTGFSSLSEMEKISEEVQGLRQMQSSYNAQMLIGRAVSATGSDGAIVEGIVTRIVRDGDEMVPYIGDQSISIASIKEISS